MAAKQGIVGLDMDLMEGSCGGNWTRLGDPCHSSLIAMFLQFADLIWPGGWEPLRFRRANASREVPFPSTDCNLVMYGVNERLLGRGGRFAGPFAYYTSTLYYSSRLLGRPNAAHLLESLSIVITPLGAHWWTALAFLVSISGCSFFVSALGREPEPLLAYSRHLLAFATTLFTFVYAQGAKAKAITLQPSVVPFADLDELETLLRQGRMQLLFPSKTSFLFRLVNNSPSGPLKRLGNTLTANPPVFREGRSANGMLQSHPHFVAVASLPNSAVSWIYAITSICAWIWFRGGDIRGGTFRTNFGDIPGDRPPIFRLRVQITRLMYFCTFGYPRISGEVDPTQSPQNSRRCIPCQISD